MRLSKTLLLCSTLFSSTVLAGTMGGAAVEDSTFNPWLFRVRAIGVLPQPASNIINIVGGEVNEMSNQIVPEFDISYFFNDYISAEAIFGTMRHSIYANDTIAGRVYLGKANLLPPTITLQYHFMPHKMLNPYIGVGINYTRFYHISPGPIASAITYSPSFGPSIQAGIDIALNDHWSVNLDVKQLFIQTQAYVNIPFGQLNPTVRLNPVIPGIGIGYKA